MAIETGMRRGDGSGREVPLSQRAFDALNESKMRADVDQPRVFPMAAGLLEQAWYRLLVRATVKGLRFHDLRHEGVSRLFERTECDRSEQHFGTQGTSDAQALHAPQRRRSGRTTVEDLSMLLRLC